MTMFCAEVTPEQQQCIQGCDRTISPACGDDGVTYPNSCVADCLDVKTTDGPCEGAGGGPDGGSPSTGGPGSTTSPGGAPPAGGMPTGSTPAGGAPPGGAPRAHLWLCCCAAAIHVLLDSTLIMWSSIGLPQGGATIGCHLAECTDDVFELRFSGS